MMRILIAPDAFKGSLTSRQAATAMATGIAKLIPNAERIIMPLADGGEGTMDVMQACVGGAVQDHMLYFHDHGQACVLIESAQCIGLTLPAMQGDIFERGSAALGRSILRALDHGVRDIRIALGGSATVDGGLGLLTALGCKVLGLHDRSVRANLHGLMQAQRMDITGLDRRIRESQITVLADVGNPLCGSRGAVYAYGKQKGMALAQMPGVDMAMLHWADLCEGAFACTVRDDAGAGAAGGLGFGLKLLGGSMVSGADYMMAVAGIEQILATVDWVVTGEGRSDAQTLDGKLPCRLARAARSAGVPVALISGDVSDMSDRKLLSDCFDTIGVARPEGVSQAEAMSQAAYYLTTAAAEWARSLD